MAVLKNKTQGQYTIVSQNITKDHTLSLAERGMLITLLSLPDNWNLTLNGLSAILPDGRDKIAKTLNSLIEKGYVTRVQGRNTGGKFDSTDLEVHEIPVKMPAHDQNTPNNPESSPCTENPYTVNPHTEKPYTDNQIQSITNKSIIQKVSTNRVCSNDTLTDSEYDDLVSEFGKESVDYQISRIKENGYKGCHNFATIREWCSERLNRVVHSPVHKPKKNMFCSFPQREYDFAELEKKLVRN